MSQATMKVQPKTKDQQTGAHAVLTARRIVAYAVLILLCALCLFFFYVLIINATRPHADIQKGFSFLPGSWTSLCNNFTQVINNANIPILSGMRNSLIVSAMTAIFACYFSALTAFGIHAYRFKGRALALTFILLIMTMPTQVSALGFVQQDTADGKQQMRQTWQHILDALCNVLRHDTKIRPDAFTEQFTPEQFAGILFSLMLSAVVQQSFDPSAVLEIVHRTIY
jgi:ABC-type glycerol-3-phosphate transport system permease component